MRGRIISALIAVLAATLTAVAAGEPARAADVPPGPGDWAELFPPFFNQSRHKCLDVPAGSNSPGLGMQVFHCHGHAGNGHPQRWLFIAHGTVSSTGNPLYLIKNIASDLCLTADGSGVSGRVVTQVRCSSDSPRQHWYQELTPLFGPHFALRNWNHSQCLATRDSSGSDGTPVVTADCTVSNPLDENTSRQVWSFG